VDVAVEVDSQRFASEMMDALLWWAKQGGGKVS
jgi:hypothetical protein